MCLFLCLQNKVRVDLHSNDADIVMVQDYAAKKTTIIYPANTTFPHGVCTVRALNEVSLSPHLLRTPQQVLKLQTAQAALTSA